MSFQSGPQRWKLLVSLQSSEASGRFLHGGRGPAHRHRGRAPSLHVSAYAPHRAHGILDDVGTGERAPQLLRQSKSRDGEDFVDAFQDRAGDTRPFSFETLSGVAKQPFGPGGLVQLPSM